MDVLIPIHTLIGCLQLCSPNSITKDNDSYKKLNQESQVGQTVHETKELLSKDAKPSFLPIYPIPLLKSRTKEQLLLLKQDIFSRSSWVSDVDIGDEQPLWATIKALNIIENHKKAISQSKSDVGLTNLLKCNINLKNPYMAPLKAKVRKLPVAHQAFLCTID